MAFITAETRSDLIALAVGMLNQAPSNTLLEELIALSVGGGSLADAADHIAKTDAFKAEYPSFQTAEQYATEIFDNITTGGTVTAEIRTAVIELATGFLTSGEFSKSGLALAIVDFLSQPAALLNDDFADIAQSVQNRSAAAEYFVVTKELGGSTDAELAAAVASVTSDADTLTAANAAADTAASAAEAVAGESFSLTTGLDSKTLGAGNDQAFATDSTTAADDTFNVSDAVDGGAGDDTFFLTVDSIGAAVTYTPSRLTNFETLSITNIGGNAFTTDVSLMAPTAIAVSASTSAVNVTNVTAGSEITLTGNTAAVDIQHKNAGLTGSSDSVSVNMIGNTGGAVIDSSGAQDIESATITATGVNSGSLVIGDSGGSTITSLTVAGSGSLAITAGDLATLTSLDASDNSGGVTYTTQVTAETVTLTGGAGNDTLTGNTGDDVISGGAGADTLSMGAAGGDDHIDGGAGNDTVTVAGVTEDDTIDGGEGTDTLEINAALAYSTVSGTNNAAGITGFETLYVNTTLSQDMTPLSGITTLLVGTGDVATLTEVSGLTTVGMYPGAGAGADLTLATDGTEDSLVVGLGSDTVQLASTATTLDAVEYESMTISSTGADGNSITVTADALTALTVAGSKNVTINLATDTGTTTLPLTTVNAAGASGTVNIQAASADSGVTVTPGSDALTVNLGDGADTVTGTAKADNLTTGKGNDTIVGNGGNDTVSAGDGNDTVTLGDGNNNVTLGAGADTLTAGDGNNVVTNTSGNSTVTLGDGTNQVTNTAGNMTVVTGSGVDTITNTAGNSDITSGAGNDVITLTAGDSTVDAGAGNDTITAGSGDDTIDGGDGTDTVNISQGSGTYGGAISNVEVVNATLSASGTIDLASIEASTLTVSASDTVGTATIKNAADGTTINIAEDLTLAGTTGTISAVRIDSVDSADVNLVVKANANAALKANTTFAGAVTVTDVVELAISTQGGSGVDNVLTHTFNNLVVDSTETTSLSITGAAYGGLNTGAITGTDAIETLSISSGAEADVTAGVIVEADALTALAYSASGLRSTISAAAVGGTTNAVLETASIVATGGASISFDTITTSSDMTSITLTADGTNSTITMAGDIDVEAGDVATTIISATNGGTVDMDAVGDAGAPTFEFGDTEAITLRTTGSGSAISAIGFVDEAGAADDVTISVAGAGSSIDLDSAALDFTSVTGTVGVSVDSYSTLDLNNGAAITSDGDMETFSMTVADDAIIANGALTVTADDWDDVSLNVNNGATMATDFLVLNASAETGAIDDLSVVATATGTTAITVDLESTDILDIGGTDLIQSAVAGAADVLVLVDGTVTLTTDGVATVDTGAATGDWEITTGNGNDDIDTDAGDNEITTGAGDDNINSGTGEDTISGGSGTDTIDAGPGADQVSGGTGADSFIQAYGDSVAATVVTDATTGAAIAAGVVLAADDTITFGNGVDVYTDFTAGTGGDTLTMLTSGAATSALGVAHDLLAAADDLLFLSGSYVSSTGVFTIKADGTGADTMIIDVDQTASDDIDGSTGIVILVGVDSDNLVAGNFI